jgi:hypothetical protein
MFGRGARSYPLRYVAQNGCLDAIVSAVFVEYSTQLTDQLQKLGPSSVVLADRGLQYSLFDGGRIIAHTLPSQDQAICGHGVFDEFFK